MSCVSFLVFLIFVAFLAISSNDLNTYLHVSVPRNAHRVYIVQLLTEQTSQMKTSGDPRELIIERISIKKLLDLTSVGYADNLSKTPLCMVKSDLDTIADRRIRLHRTEVTNDSVNGVVEP